MTQGNPTDFRALSDAEMAAIAKRIAYARSIVWLEESKPIDGLQAAGDRVALSDHAAYLAERLAEAERLLTSVLTEVDDDFDGFTSVRSDVVDFLGKDPRPWTL